MTNRFGESSPGVRKRTNINNTQLIALHHTHGLTTGLLGRTFQRFREIIVHLAFLLSTATKDFVGRSGDVIGMDERLAGDAYRRSTNKRQMRGGRNGARVTIDGDRKMTKDNTICLEPNIAIR